MLNNIDNRSLNMLKAVLMIAIAIKCTSGQVPFAGSCPNVETVGDFDANQYLGKWYEAERYFAVFEFGGKCVTADYSLDKKNGAINIINKQTSALTGLRSSIKGIGTIVGRAGDAKLSVVFPSLPVSFASPYWIVDTDYDNYAIVWSCSNFGLFNTRNAWILTRARGPNLDVMEKAYKSLDKNGINRSYLIRTDQKNCPSI